MSLDRSLKFQFLPLRLMKIAHMPQKTTLTTRSKDATRGSWHRYWEHSYSSKPHGAQLSGDSDPGPGGPSGEGGLQGLHQAQEDRAVRKTTGDVKDEEVSSLRGQEK